MVREVMLQANVKYLAAAVVTGLMVRSSYCRGSNDIIHERVRGHVDANIAPVTSTIDGVIFSGTKPLMSDRITSLHEEKACYHYLPHNLPFENKRYCAS